MESTSTICKIRNLEAVKIKAKRNNALIEEEIVLSEDCDMSCESGVENLRTVLTNLTDIVDSKNLVDYEYVDVGFPIPFLKVITCQNKIL